MIRLLICLAALLAALPEAAAAQQVTGTRRQPSTVPHAIVGRVTDSAGHSMPGVLVVALQLETSSGHTALTPVSRPISSITNARGQFRLSSSFLGDHYLVAFPRNRPFAAVDRAGRAGYAVTYYPNAVDAARARPIVLGVHSTATADIVMAPATLAAISGRVLGSDRRPVRGGALLIAHGSLFGLDSAAVPIRPDGTFATPGLSPGTYFLHFREGLWPPPAAVIPKVSGAEVTIAGTDLANVQVLPIAMARVSGRVVVSRAARAALPYATIEVGASPINFEGNPGPQRPGIVRKDLSFEFWTWPGEGRVRVLLLSPGWAVQAVRLHGADVTDRAVDFRRDVTGLEIEVVERNPEPSSRGRRRNGLIGTQPRL